MLDPTTLFTYESHVDPRTVKARTLVVTLGSFVDAGHAQRLLDDHLRNSLSSHRLGSFDADQLVSYREQRPSILFTSDTFSQYATPDFGLHHVTDASGEGFLLLTGPEPGLAWERMAATIAAIVDRHDVQLTMLAQSMPMPTPHTRPVLLSRWSNRPEMLVDNKPMFGTILMHSAFPAMLSQRLGEKGMDAVGLTAHVPHYLADTDFPDAVISLVAGLREVAKLDIPTIQLAVAAGVARAQIGTQIEASEELSEHVSQLEEQYDEFHRQREIAAAEETLPSADEIGEAAEEFLKTLGAPGAQTNPMADGVIDPDAPGDSSPEPGDAADSAG